MVEGACHCGAVRWRLDPPPESVTACNCTICRRYGVLWAYGHIGHEIHATGATRTYRRADGGAIDFHFCPACGCVTHYVATRPNAEGRHWTAVNMRLADPAPWLDLPIDHFDGLHSFDDLPRDGRTLRDLWF
ncbi:GFA family protein [Rhodobacterales bacterium HKCCE2091]|nr:GFA family protein [Rhodobacterales bacterium HKCCE2091]